MIKEKEKGGGARLKDEPNDPAEPGHGSRPPSASLPTPAALKKEPDEHRVKMEPHSQSGGEDSTAELAVDGIKTEIDGLMDSDGDPTKSPSCDLGGPGSLKSERLSSDSNDILDPQTGLRGSAGNIQDGNQNCRNPNVGPESMGSCRMGGGGGPMGPGVSMGPMSASEAQTLPSNVISKQAGSMEQQSQIFVFSTLLANKGAEAVISGQHHSIIAYHCAQPGTKKYLEKHPLKMGQFNKQSPAQWLNNMAMAKRAGMRGGPNMMGGPNQMGHMMGGPMGPNMGPMGHGGMGHMGPNMMGPNRMGGPGNQMMMMKGGPGPMGQMGPGMGPMDGFPGGTPSCGVMDGIGADGEMPWDTKNPSVMSNGMANGGGVGGVGGVSGVGGGGGGGPGGAGLPACSEAADAPPQDAPPADAPCQQGPKGVKIPDENLTPQQRAHREEQLATIRKMQQMLFPESGGSSANQGPGDGTQPSNEVNPPNSAGNMNMPFPPMSGMGPNGPMGSGPNGPMVSMPNSMNSGPSCSMAGPMGPSGPMGPGPMGPGGPMGPNGPMGGPMGGMGGPGGMGMGGHGSMGPNGMMGPNGPMMPGMGPNGPMGPLGPCGMKGIRGACGGPDMKGGMCTDMHMGRGCGGPMGRMPNPMGGMGGPKPCMMGGPHMGPRMMPGPNINAMNGGIMMDGMMGGMVHGECGDHHSLPNGPMCDEYGRGRNMGPGDPGGLGPGGLGAGAAGAARGLRSPKSPAPAADIDWQKLHHQFFDDPKSMDAELGTQVKSPCSERGGCLPPPPYGASPLHRSASVPIATASPGHGGVQLPMSAEASRAPSALSSPAHCKPPPKQDPAAPEILEKLDDGVFVRTLQCLAAQQQKNQQGGSHAKEPSLMPVPSPQQISYLNQFEGQELTIQKQPNTSLKDNGPPSNSGGQTPQSSSNQKSPAGMMPGTPEPHSSLAEQRAGRFSLEQSPGFNNPQTPTSTAATKCAQDEKSRPSPSSNRSSQDSASKTPQRDSNLNQGPYAPASSASSCAGSVKSSCSVASSTAPTTASGSIEDNMTPSSETTLSGGPNSTSLPGPFPSACSMTRPDNIPINPNQGPGGPMGGAAASFDPISSLAQMSQQLTSGAPGPGPGPGASGPGPGPMGPFAPQPHHLPHHPMHPHSHPHMMMNDLGCHMDNMGGPGMGGPMEGMMGGGEFPPDINLSPKMGGGGMGGMGAMGGDGMIGARGPGGGKMPPFNGANVQVKASAPNTIQYLPTRPQMACNSGPRGPPSLEFLQRVTSPMQLDGGKGVQYFPGARGLEPEGGMRGVLRGPGMLRMAPYPAGFGSPPKMDPFGPAAAVCGPGPGFRGGKGALGPGVRMGAAQPLPPSMAGPGPGFKGQGFAMQSTADPTYAAQFHNFQQQLYATGSRGAQPHQAYPPYQPPK
ncbi:collagen alpha-1(I) chain-like isoform X3 [Galleria mellonella]|uniref:Collagen alpha-1(I) chain-like isoform X3 n=1 Tax=Galleria mellonella TaxID=7137 RepID=A0ABM3MP45_GALME|nr:collagen alpha-1(I) chain-like isoform X3 [Galleria mellonella]